jgi:nucleoside-diphosphate kinase
MVLEGNGAIAIVRKLMGATFGPNAEPGTLRGDFGVSRRFNLVHGSDSPEAAAHEIALFFRPEELIDWTPADWQWRYDFSTGECV